ncbi:FtsK/SpoIIIE domain-containing protein [Streptomyces californicus]|uniref:FtsK/SpoIIIE domain-containing protein n=1 Tax=Streptomyces californicus TaxID=67351 RepID=UPI0036AD46DF
MSFDLESARTLPAQHDMTTMTTIATPTVNELQNRRSATIYVPSSSSTSPSSSRKLWPNCADWLVRSGRWIARRRYELIPVTATTSLTILGLAQDSLTATLSYGALTAAGGASAFLGLKHKNDIITHAGAGATVTFADLTTASAAGLSWPTLTAWAISTGIGYWAFGPWLTQQRNQRLKLHIDTVRAKGPVTAALGMETADPGLVGYTPEETALRRALHALTNHTPREITAFHHTPDGGFIARVRMPAGRNTSPDALIKKRDQLAANLALPGDLQLNKTGSDELLVRLIATDVLAGTIPYSDDSATSIADPLRLGIDEYGDSVDIRILYRHTLVAGASDWGKSGLINLIIKRLTRRADVDIYGIDMKPGSVELGPWEPLMKKVAKGPEEARELLDWLGEESQRRGKILADLSARELAAGRDPVRKWVPGVHGNAIVVITDELAELIRQDEVLRKREAEERKIMMKGISAEDLDAMDIDDLIARQPVATQYESRLAIDRFLAISYVSATQQPSRKVFGGSTDARGNYANRLSTRTGEAGHAPLIFGQGCQAKGWRPEELDLPGKFLLATPEPENEKPRECRAEYVSDTDIAADVSHLHARAARDLLTHTPETPPAPEPTDAHPFPVPAPLRYPDGTPVANDEWPDLYRTFQRLGNATKDELTHAGPFASRDTVRRALETWTRHGIQGRREGRATRYYLPDANPND